jgi:hypothetical protein
MSSRELLRKAIMERVNSVVSNTGAADEITGEVMKLFAVVTQEINEADVTSLGDAVRRVTWDRVIVARMCVDHGTYLGAPMGWEAR